MSSLRSDLEWLCVPRSPEREPEALARVRDRLRDEFRSMGYSVEEQRLSGDAAPYPNLIARLEGREEGPLHIVGAHYDSVPLSPGADDNASAVAALLHAMRALAGTRPRTSIVFAAYSLEEYGFLGSREHARSLKVAGTRVGGMVSLEMLGYTSATQNYPPGLGLLYPKEGRFIAAVGDWASRPFVSRWVEGMRRVEGLDVQTLAAPGASLLLPELRLSDHSPFWDEGFPALMLTDTSFFRNPHYHLPSDTLDTLDLGFLAKVADGVVRALVHVAGAATSK